MMAMAVFLTTGCVTEGEPPTSEPAVADNSPLLLLDDDDEAGSSEPVAENDRCFVCHMNYHDEKIAVTHAWADIGCADCHGDSDEHIADESWASGGNGTPPDTMFTRNKVNPFCMDCHSKDTLDEDQHKAVFVKSKKKRKVCTDCHGDHRLAHRTCEWK